MPDETSFCRNNCRDSLLRVQFPQRKRFRASAASTQFNEAHFSEEEKHKIYTAALAADESPLDSALFKEVCKKIGIFDAEGKPNDKYMVFVAEHVEWAMKPELELFRSEINTKEKAREYVNRQLAR